MGKKSYGDPRRLKQPYTSHHVTQLGIQVFGFTYESVITNEPGADEPEWGYRWEQHDLGLFEGRNDAYEAAKDWRESLVGMYEII